MKTHTPSTKKHRISGDFYTGCVNFGCVFFPVGRRGGASILALIMALSMTSASRLTAAVTFTVDANSIVKSDAGGDDMKTIKGYINSASWAVFSTQSVYDTWLNPIGFNGVRGIGLSDAGCSLNLTTGVFTPSTQGTGGLKEYLEDIRANKWKMHLVVGQDKGGTNPALGAFSGWGALDGTYPDYSTTASSNDWKNYQKFARAYIRYVAANSHPGVLVADDFADKELTANPAWTLAGNIGADPLWRVINGLMVFSTHASEANRVLGIPVPNVPSTTTPTYITFDLRTPVTSDFRPVAISLVKTATNSGYTIYAAPTPGYGNQDTGPKSGFASGNYPGGAIAPIGATNMTLVNSNVWQNVCIKFDPVAHTINLSLNGKTVYTRTGVSTGFSFDRLEFKNVNGVTKWELRNLFVGDRPGDPLGDNFNDANLTATSGQAWTVTEEGTTRNWAVTNQRLVCAAGAFNTGKPTIGANLFPAQPGVPLNISFKVRYPDVGGPYNNRIRFSICDQLDSNKGYSLYACGNPDGYGPTGAKSGFAFAPYNQNANDAGEVGETLGVDKPNAWETIQITFDPAANLVTMTRDGLLVARIPNNSQGMTKVTRFEITNFGYAQPAWEVDDVYAWYGREELPEILFEVENEPDIMLPKTNSIHPWWSDGDYAHGGLELYNNYMQLFKLWSGAVEMASREIPRPLRVGGPSGGPFTTHYGTGSGGGQSWMEKMAAECATGGIRFDDMTVHYYGDNTSVWNRPLTNPGVYESLSGQVADMRTALNSTSNNNWLNKTRINITEWGAHEAVVTDNFTIYNPDPLPSPTPTPVPGVPVYDPVIGLYRPNSVKNVNHLGAAWAAAFLHNLLDIGVEKAVFLSTQDLQNANGRNNWAFAGFLSTDGMYPKPIFNVASMLSKMKGTRVDVAYPTGNPYPNGNMGCLASVDTPSTGTKTLAVLVYNYNLTYASPAVDNTVDTDVALMVSNLPSAWNGSVTATRYDIDETHSNVYASVLNSSLNQNTPSGKLESTPITGLSVSNGSLTIPTTTMKKSSVSLWVITK